MVQDLVPLEYKMNESDTQLLKRLVSRQKDDEDFDAFATAQLQKLHATYKPARSKKELEERWKAMTSGGKKL
jgi:putative heme degradation protein